MKTSNINEFRITLSQRKIKGNNIIYADKSGNIGYWHGNFVPYYLDPAYGWKRAVYGSTSATEWKGVHRLEEIPQYINPANGWLQNCNSTILYGTGLFDSTMYSTKPFYMFPDGHTPRAEGAIRVLTDLKDATIDDVITAAHDTYLANAAR